MSSKNTVDTGKILSLFIIMLYTLQFVSCSGKESEDRNYSIISGKIKNDESGQFILISGLNTNEIDTVKLSIIGEFRDTIWDVKGSYDLITNLNKTSIYLEEGYDLKFNAEANDLRKTIKFEGEGATENKFLKERDSIFDETINFSKLYQMEEEGFQNKITDLHDLQVELLEKTDSLPQSFITYQKQDIKYEYLSFLSNYERMHKHFSGLSDYSASQEFLKPLEDINYSKEEDFKKFASYRGIVRNHYFSKSENLAALDSIPREIASIKVYGGVENEFIRTKLLNGSITSIVMTQHLEDFYSAFKEASTDSVQLAQIESKYNKLKLLQPGNPSPKFFDFEKYGGGTASLDDFRGKYVLIDVWATWCGPCIAEIPALKELEKEFEGKDLTFISISIDEIKDYEKWKKMVDEKQLGGVQLWAKSNPDSKFTEEYSIQFIPKFILLDKKGYIVDAYAPKPSDPEMRNILEGLNM